MNMMISYQELVRTFLKPDIDPLQVNINIAALGGYYLINQHTLGLVYHISMVSPLGTGSQT